MDLHSFLQPAHKRLKINIIVLRPQIRFRPFLYLRLLVLLRIGRIAAGKSDCRNEKKEENFFHETNLCHVWRKHSRSQPKAKRRPRCPGNGILDSTVAIFASPQAQGMRDKDPVSGAEEFADGT